MKKYLALYMASMEQLEKWSTETPDANSMDEWNLWMESHKDVLVDMGAPLGKTKRVSKDGVSDTRNGVCGYTIVEVGSFEEATEVFKDSPHLKYGDTWMEVIECMEMPSR